MRCSELTKSADGGRDWGRGEGGAIENCPRREDTLHKQTTQNNQSEEGSFHIDGVIGEHARRDDCPKTRTHAPTRARENKP